MLDEAVEHFVGAARLAVGTSDPAALYERVLADIETAWRAEIGLQQEASDPAILSAGYRELAETVSERVCLLLGIAARVRKGEAPGLREDQIEATVGLATSWLENLAQSPVRWEPIRVSARRDAGFRDRVAAKLDILRGTGIEVVP